MACHTAQHHFCAARGLLTATAAPEPSSTSCRGCLYMLYITSMASQCLLCSWGPAVWCQGSVHLDCTYGACQACKQTGWWHKSLKVFLLPLLFCSLM